MPLKQTPSIPLDIGGTIDLRFEREEQDISLID